MSEEPEKKDVCENVIKACEEARLLTLDSIPLESADMRLLDVREADIDEHVAMQPAAIAYYGYLKKTAARQLVAFKHSHDRWHRKKYAEAKAALTSISTKFNIADIEAKFIVDNEPEIERQESQMAEFQRQCDTLDVWYDAWRQKSYSIREHIELAGDEYSTSPHVMSSGKKSLHSEKINRVRDIIKGNKET